MEQTRLNVDKKSIKEFVEHIAANGAEPHTQKRYEHDVKMFADFLGECKIFDHKKLSMRAFKDFYTVNFENIRSEMAELIDEDLRILHTPPFAVRNENPCFTEEYVHC